METHGLRPNLHVSFVAQYIFCRGHRGEWVALSPQDSLRKFGEQSKRNQVKLAEETLRESPAASRKRKATKLRRHRKEKDTPMLGSLYPLRGLPLDPGMARGPGFAACSPKTLRQHTPAIAPAFFSSLFSFRSHQIYVFLFTFPLFLITRYRFAYTSEAPLLFIVLAVASYMRKPAWTWGR